MVHPKIHLIKNIPGPKVLPIIGTLHLYNFGSFPKNKYHEALQFMYQKYGPVVRENRGGTDVIHIFEPEDIKTVYRQGKFKKGLLLEPSLSTIPIFLKVYNNEGKWPRIPPIQETTQIYRKKKKLSLGLGNANGEEWYRLRSNTQKIMLQAKEVQRHLSQINAVAQELVENIEESKMADGKVSHFNLLVAKWSLENGSRMVFGKNMDALKRGSSGELLAEKLINANDKVSLYSSELKLSIPFYKYFPTKKWISLYRAEDYLNKTVHGLCQEAIQNYQRDVKSANRDLKEKYIFLDYFMSKPDLSVNDISIACFSLFTIGLITTVPALLFNIYCLATNPLSQHKLYEEIKSVMKNDVNVTQDHIDQMVYLKAFVKETFRLWPNGTEVSRYLNKDLILSGYTVPEGTFVDMNAFVLFRDETFFPKPMEHNPDRWFNKNLDLHSHAYLPFSHGPRMCPGKRLSEQDLYVALITLVKRFEMKYSEDEKLDQIWTVMLFPDKNVNVQFYTR